MISRRALIAGALAALASPLPARAASGCIVGAIRWDAWYGSGVTTQVQNTLGPSAWQFRAPWFATALNANQISVNGNSQTNIDLEITAAHAAGLKFWAYCWYPGSTGAPDSSGFMNAWALHQSSSIKSLMNWCLILQESNLGGASGFTAMITQYVSYCAQANYQTVLSGRPLVFLLLSDKLSAAWATALASFRSACIAAGLASPYAVLMGTDATTSAQAYAISGADAISQYGAGAIGTYANLSSIVAAEWAVAVTDSLPIVPWVSCGWDVRPRKQNPTTWELQAPFVGMLNYTAPGTVAERVAQFQAAINYVNAHPSACPSTAIIAYSWTECDEGGGALIPTLGDPPSSSSPYLNSMLTALSAILP